MSTVITLKGMTLSGLTDWLLENYKCKITGQPFNINDVKAYCLRKKLPKYFGKTKIEKIYTTDKRVKLYKIIMIEDAHYVYKTPEEVASEKQAKKEKRTNKNK